MSKKDFPAGWDESQPDGMKARSNGYSITMKRKATKKPWPKTKLRLRALLTR